MDTVAICDTEPIVILGLRSLLEPEAGLHILCSGSSPAGILELIRANPPRVVVIDKAFGVPAVLDFVRSLRRNHPLTVPVVWGTTMSENEALRFLQAGAAGVVERMRPSTSCSAVSGQRRRGTGGRRSGCVPSRRTRR